MTNEQAIERISEKFKTIRRNKDGSVNGNASHGYYASLKATFKANGMPHNDACVGARKVIRELKTGASQ